MTKWVTLITSFNLQEEAIKLFHALIALKLKKEILGISFIKELIIILRLEGEVQQKDQCLQIVLGQTT